MSHQDVAILMGSDSDWPTMKEAAHLLKEFGIQCDVQVLSAHRTPKRVQKYASNAESKGFKVVIAAAGGAAHLAGVVASFTKLPVIGVPMKTSALGGVDSLYSTVQMPAGVPVATVGIGVSGAINAAVLAVKILAISDSSLSDKLEDYRIKLTSEAMEKNASVKKQLEDDGKL